MRGLTIDTARLARVADNPTPRRAAAGERATRRGRGRGGMYVTAEVLADAAGTYADCRCDELGLVVGMATSDLVELGSGCTGETPDGRRLKPAGSGGWVCPRLDTVRRRYGL